MDVIVNWRVEVETKDFVEARSEQTGARVRIPLSFRLTLRADPGGCSTEGGPKQGWWRLWVDCVGYVNVDDGDGLSERCVTTHLSYRIYPSDS